MESDVLLLTCMQAVQTPGRACTPAADLCSWQSISCACAGTRQGQERYLQHTTASVTSSLVLECRPRAC